MSRTLQLLALAAATAASAAATPRGEWDGFDALSMATETRSSAGPVSQTFTYDTSHQLRAVVRGLARVDSTYQPGTRRMATRHSGPNGLTYQYDALGRLREVAGPWGTTPVAWEAGGQRLTTLGTESFISDGRGWLTSVTTPSRTTTYSYDGRGNRLSESVSGTSALAGFRRFSYDDADRLTASQEWDGHLEAWALSPDGTRIAAKQWPAGTPWPATGPFSFATPNPTTWQTYAYRPGDKVLERVSDVVSGLVDIQYTHDDNGQVTSRTEAGVSTSFAWDVDGRLVSAASSGPGLPSLSATYQYDALGMRRSAEVTLTPLAPASPVTTTRIWTWGGPNGEEEEAEDFNVTTSVAGFRVGDGLNSFSHDGLGSILSQTDFTTGLTNDARFGAWGTRSVLGFGPLASSAGFTGHRVEEALGLSYAKRRWLDSSTGTWLSRDDVGAASYLLSPNELYAHGYAAGNPMRFTDPSGRQVPGESSPVTTCKMGNISACIAAGMTEEQAYAHVARQTATATTAEAVVEEVTTQVVLQVPTRVLTATDVGLRALGLGAIVGGAVGAKTAQVRPTQALANTYARACRRGDPVMCGILRERVRSGDWPPPMEVPGVESTESGGVSVAANVGPNASVVPATRYPNQTCTDAELDALEAWKKGVCAAIPGNSCSPRKVSPKKLERTPCSEIRARLAAMRACAAARKRVQDVCFGGMPDPKHKGAIDDVQSGISHCEALELVNCSGASDGFSIGCSSAWEV